MKLCCATYVRPSPQRSPNERRSGGERQSMSLTMQQREHPSLRFGIVTEAVDPFHIRLASKPRQLTLGIVPHITFGLLNSAFKGTFAFEVFDHSPVSMRAKRARLRWHALIEQALHFVN